MRKHISLSAIWLQGCQVFYSPHNLDAVLWLTFSYCLQLVPSPAPFVLALVMAQDTRHKLAQLNPLIAVFFLSFFSSCAGTKQNYPCAQGFSEGLKIPEVVQNKL